MKWFVRLSLAAGVVTLIAVFIMTNKDRTKPTKKKSQDPVHHVLHVEPEKQINRRIHVEAVSKDNTVEVDMEALLQEARKKPACADVIKNPKSFWKSQPGPTKFTAKQDVTRMTTGFRCGVLDEDFLRTPPYGIFYPFEKSYMSQPPVTNLSGVTSLEKTVISLARSAVKVGKEVTVTVETRDAAGNRKSVGGDEVWVWFVDTAGRNVITASVLDLGNGTYEATSALQWPGTFRVKVAIAYPREYLRALIHIHRVYKHTRLFVGNFANEKADETTPCYHNFAIPGGYTDFCNLTTVNGSPWFCGRPVKPELTCGDFKGGHNGDFGSTQILPLTAVESKLIHTSYTTHATHLVKKSLQVSATAPDKRQYPLACGEDNTCPYCNEISPRHTWNLTQPTGYLYKGIWYPRNCKLRPFTPKQCFKDTQWVLLGDSNLRSHYYKFSQQAGAVDILKAETKKWHKPLSCKSAALNFNMTWGPHAEPFLNGGLIAELGSLVPSVTVIDSLSSKGRHVIILNHFYHISGCHSSSIHTKLLAIRDALVRFFRRNNNSIALLHSPHISWKGWSEHFGAGDMLGRHLIQLEQDIFSDPALRDRVIYLPMWDITQAIENVEFHPNEYPIMSKLMQHYLCGRRLEFKTFSD